MAVAQGELERAARLAGVGEELCETSGIPLPAAARVGYGRVVDAVRTQLEAETVAAAWAEGRAMTTEQAIAYALGREDDGPVELPQSPESV